MDKKKLHFLCNHRTIFFFFFFKQDPHTRYSLLFSWQHVPNWVPVPQTLLGKWVTPSLISIEGENRERGYLFPPPLSLSFLMLMGVRSSIPGTICPSSGFGPQALQTCPIVCVCPSRKWWAGMVLVAQKAPPSTARACCSLAYMWRWEGCSRALCAATSGPSAVCSTASAAQILCCDVLVE